MYNRLETFEDFFNGEFFKIFKTHITSDFESYFPYNPVQMDNMINAEYGDRKISPTFTRWKQKYPLTDTPTYIDRMYDAFLVKNSVLLKTIKKNLEIEYNPLENRTYKDNTTETEKTESANKTDTHNINKVSAFDSEDFSNDNESNSNDESSGNIDRTKSNLHEYSELNTFTSNAIDKEIEFKINNIYCEIACKIIIDFFCIKVY